MVVDEQQRTTDEKIFAIGDVVGGPLLAHKAIHEGKTLHFAPRKGIYVLFRLHKEEVVCIVLNKTNSKSLNTSEYKELELQGKKFIDVETKESIIWNNNLPIHPNGITLITTKLH